MADPLGGSSVAVRIPTPIRRRAPVLRLEIHVVCDPYQLPLRRDSTQIMDAVAIRGPGCAIRPPASGVSPRSDLVKIRGGEASRQKCWGERADPPAQDG